MSIWKLYTSARKAINGFLAAFFLPLILEILLLILVNVENPYADVNVSKICIPIMILFMLVCFPILYYEYLDDIFFKRIVTYQGYIARIGIRKTISDTDRRDLILEKYPKLYSIKRINIYCSNKRNTPIGVQFDWYNKKKWNIVKVGDIVRFTYLLSSKIIIDLQVLDDTGDNKNNINKNSPIGESNGIEVSDEKRKLEKQKTIKKIFRTALFTVLSIIAGSFLLTALEYLF